MTPNELIITPRGSTEISMYEPQPMVHDLSSWDSIYKDYSMGIKEPPILEWTTINDPKIEVTEIVNIKLNVQEHDPEPINGKGCVLVGILAEHYDYEFQAMLVERQFRHHYHDCSLWTYKFKVLGPVTCNVGDED